MRLCYLTNANDDPRGLLHGIITHLIRDLHSSPPRLTRTMLEIATRIMIGSIFHCYEPGAWRAKIESFAYRRDRVNEIFSGVSLRVSLFFCSSLQRGRDSQYQKKKAAWQDSCGENFRREIRQLRQLSSSFFSFSFFLSFLFFSFPFFFFFFKENQSSTRRTRCIFLKKNLPGRINPAFLCKDRIFECRSLFRFRRRWNS